MNLTRVIQSSIPQNRSVFLPLAAVLALWTTGCGTAPSSGTAPSGLTTVAIQLSAKANDQLVQYTTQIASISLTNQVGKTTTIFSTPTNVDFIPMNGNAYPLALVQVAQDVYTSASIGMATPNFRYTFLDSTGSDNTVNYTYLGTTPVPVIVVPQPVTISGSSMGLQLSLDVSKSLVIGNYRSPSTSTFTGNPTLNLSVFPLTAGATTPLNGKCIGLIGQITAMSLANNTMTVTLAGDGAIGPGQGLAYGAYATGASFTVLLSSATQYQGVAAANGLAIGDFVNVDLALQPGGYYIATRVEVQDATTTNVTTNLVQYSSATYSALGTMAVQYQGLQLEATDAGNAFSFLYAGSTKFQTSARLAGIAGLPFTPTFSSTTMVAGQNVSIGANSYPFTGGTFSLPTSVTLLPQTIDAVITGVATSGGYTIYTASLAAYDPIVQLNGPPINPNANPVTNPNIVQVYVGSSTSLLNATQLATGGTFRFNGLLFDDGGVLRLVALQVNDGVAQ
jgi:Domain of unknown function (DUF5666)